MSSADNPPRDEKFRIAIVGSGPIGKLLACSVTPHPCVAYNLFDGEEQTVLSDYDLGPEFLHTINVLNPKLGQAIRQKSRLSQTWMNIYHSGDQDRLIEAVEMSEDRLHGHISRRDLLDLLNSHTPSDVIQHKGRMAGIEKLQDGTLELILDDGSTTTANAVWACDGIDSLCRKVLQGDRSQAAESSGVTCYHVRVPSSSLAKELAADLALETYAFIGVGGWSLFTHPSAKIDELDITAFTTESKQPNGEDILHIFPGRNKRADKLLRKLTGTLEPPRRVELDNLVALDPFYHPDLCLTTFGDAASGKLPHLGGSLSSGAIGVSVFLHDGLNPLIDRLSHDATNEEITSLIMEASGLYDVTHRSLAQKLLDFSNEQGRLWMSGSIDIEELTRRPKFLWTCADTQR
ncbi:putative salicylate hydroxylase [Seiridium cardinale]